MGVAAVPAGGDRFRRGDVARVRCVRLAKPGRRRSACAGEGPLMKPGISSVPAGGRDRAFSRAFSRSPTAVRETGVG